MIDRLLTAHEEIIEKVRLGIERTGANGDWSSNDLLMSDALRRHGFQVWFVAEHVVSVPALVADPHVSLSELLGGMHELVG